jgi:hypothetical protein
MSPSQPRASRPSTPVGKAPPACRAATQAAWAVGDFALARQLNRQAIAEGAADAPAAREELQRLGLDGWIVAYGAGSTCLVGLAWIWALRANGS